MAVDIQVGCCDLTIVIGHKLSSTDNWDRGWGGGGDGVFASNLLPNNVKIRQNKVA